MVQLHFFYFFMIWNNKTNIDFANLPNRTILFVYHEQDLYGKNIWYVHMYFSKEDLYFSKENPWLNFYSMNDRLLALCVHHFFMIVPDRPMRGFVSLASSLLIGLLGTIPIIVGPHVLRFAFETGWSVCALCRARLYKVADLF